MTENRERDSEDSVLENEYQQATVTFSEPESKLKTFALLIIVALFTLFILIVFFASGTFVCIRVASN